MNNFCKNDHYPAHSPAKNSIFEFWQIIGSFIVNILINYIIRFEQLKYAYIVVYTNTMLKYRLHILFSSPKNLWSKLFEILLKCNSTRIFLQIIRILRDAFNALSKGKKIRYWDVRNGVENFRICSFCAGGGRILRNRRYQGICGKSW